MDQVKFVEDRPYYLKFCEGYLAHILLGPFLNTLTKLSLVFKNIFTLFQYL